MRRASLSMVAGGLLLLALAPGAKAQVTMTPATPQPPVLPATPQPSVVPATPQPAAAAYSYRSYYVAPGNTYVTPRRAFRPFAQRRLRGPSYAVRNGMVVPTNRRFFRWFR